MAGQSNADELKKLAELRDSGVLSPEEFEAQKARLLAGPSPVSTSAPAPPPPPPQRVPTPPIVSPTAPAAPRPAVKQASAKKKKRRGWTVLVLLVIIIVIIIVAVSSGSKSPATHAQKAAAFNSFESSVKSGLNSCNVATQDVQVELGLVLQAGNAASTSDLVQLDTAAKNAQAPCDDTQDNALLNMETESVPGTLSGLSGLSNAPTDAGTWATDTGKVLHDIENLAQSSGSAVGLTSQLDGDVSNVNNDQSTLNSDFQAAASSLNITFNGLGLAKWSS